MTGLLLGIDTGGTYTDGVLLDEASRQVIATTKTITTRHNLTECILKALDELLPDDPSQIHLVSISTTLATNAIAEGKGRPVALYLLGYDSELVKKFQLEREFASSRYYYFQGGHNLDGEEQTPLALAAILEKASALKEEVEAFAVSGYFSPFNPDHEIKSFRAITEAIGMPVVLGHQLSTKLNSIQRAATATINASLLAIIQNFILAIRNSLDARTITAPLMVVRGDGALMNANVAEKLPVETVHSGPAASAIGGRFLSGKDKALVIDIGGTTTDIAVIDRGRVNVSEEGTTVGGYRTAVRSTDVRSMGLGGDSQISLDSENRLIIGPQRVVPISYLAQSHPKVANHIRHLSQRSYKRRSPDYIEYWFLQRGPSRPIENELGRQVIEMLRKQPMVLPEILERMGLFHHLQFGGAQLIKEEIIGQAALTPTDLLHITGEFAPWDISAAQIAAAFMARLKDVQVEDLIAEVMTYIAERITAEVVSFTSGQSLQRMPKYVARDDLGLWLFDENLYQQHPYLGSSISLKIPIIGIGAPAKIFLPRVAEMLHTELIVPPHFQVANAVGAVSGSVISTQDAWVYPKTRGMHIVGYYVQISGKRHSFPNVERALAYANEVTRDAAIASASTAGAIDPQLETEQLPDGAESYRVRARAFGNPRLGEAS